MYSLRLLLACVLACVLVYLQYPVLYKSTNRNIPHLKGMASKWEKIRYRMSCSKLWSLELRYNGTLEQLSEEIIFAIGSRGRRKKWQSNYIIRGDPEARCSKPLTSNTLFLTGKVNLPFHIPTQGVLFAFY